MQLTIGLPSGIGDFSWGWSKLYAIRDQIKEIRIADGWPYRTTPYVELCWSPEERLARPNNGASYGTFAYKDIQMFEGVNEIASNPSYIPTWADVFEKVGGYAQILLQPNAHLEHGRPLHYWLSDLPTKYHYPLYTSTKDAAYAENLVTRLRLQSPHVLGIAAPLVGISCASYRGSEAWKTWGSGEWVAFLEKIVDAGWQPVILGGFWDDLSSNVAAALSLPDLVGRTDVAQMIEVLKRLDAYIGFSSGLGVIRTVLNLPAMSLWPDFQKELSTAWPPPDMLSSGRYVAAPWRDPVTDTWPVARRFLELCEEERHAKGKTQTQGQEA